MKTTGLLNGYFVNRFIGTVGKRAANAVLLTIFSAMLGTGGAAAAPTPSNPRVLPSGLSAFRPKGVSYREMVESHLTLSSGRYPKTPYQSRQSLARINWQQVPEVSAQDLQAIFVDFRDNKPLTDDANRPRRLTWLYPDDGCYARAELMIDNAEKTGKVVPHKIFVFGDLSVKTPNHPAGEVTWWYHVAPILRVGATAYVLDPSVDSSRPLPVKNWAALMNSKVEVATCSPHTYDPDGKCEDSQQVLSPRAVSDEIYFLSEEWDRIETLGRDPDAELGDSPPWRKSIARSLQSRYLL